MRKIDNFKDPPMNPIELGRIDLNLLTVLAALMRERHVSRAAERLHLGQPAVSHALARLRAYAFAEGRSVSDVALDVLAGRVRFDD